MFSLAKRDFFDDMFDVFPFDKKWSVAYQSYWDKEENLVIERIMPGFQKGEISLSITDDVLLIKAESKKPVSSLVTGYFREEMKLPKGIDTEKMTAEYKSGILAIKIPKNDEMKSKKIEIKL